VVGVRPGLSDDPGLEPVGVGGVLEEDPDGRRSVDGGDVRPPIPVEVGRRRPYGGRREVELDGGAEAAVAGGEDECGDDENLCDHVPVPPPTLVGR